MEDKCQEDTNQGIRQGRLGLSGLAKDLLRHQRPGVTT